MKLLIWSVFALMALLWTGGAFALASALQWAVGMVASGDAAQWGQSVAAWPVPAWMSYWLDPAALRAAMEGVVWSLDALQQARPWVGALMAWLVPAVWVMWGLGLVTILMLAVAAHLLLRWWLRRRAAQAIDPGEPRAPLTATR